MYPTYDTIEVPVVTERESKRFREDPRAREVQYYIVHQMECENSKGKPFALVMLHHHPDGTPSEWYMGYFYRTLEEALSIAQLCEWHARQGDEGAQDCLLRNHTLGNIQSKQAYDLLLSCGHPELAPQPFMLEVWGRSGRPGALLFQPSLEDLNAEILGRRKDWRDLWMKHLPPDPLRLIQMEPSADHPTIDWSATIIRTAATVARSHSDGRWWSHISDSEDLLRHQRIPLSSALLKAHLMIWVWEHPSLATFGKRPSFTAACDDILFSWKSRSWLTEVAAEVPVCRCCGHPRTLPDNCTGFFYGDITAWEGPDAYVLKACPFDGYGCHREGETFSWNCCHCRAIMQKVDGKASRDEIEEEIAQQMQQFVARGGSPLRIC